MKKYLILCFFVFFFLSCGNKNDNGIYIPREKFIAILTDIHLADAYYASHYQLSKLHNDSVNFYNTVLEKYGYTKAQFDTTLKYYAVRTQEFDLLYEEVVTALNKTEQENYQLRPMDSELAKKLWTGKNSWYLPKEGSRKKVPINLKIKGKGKYVISFTYKMFHDDKSLNPRLTLYFAADSGSVEKKDSLSIVEYKKDARTSIVALTKELRDSSYTHLRGFLLDHDEKSGKWKKHVIIEGLNVSYMPLYQ